MEFPKRLSTGKSIMHKASLSRYGVDEWFQDKSDSTFWLRIYTSLLIPHDQFVPKLQGAVQRLGVRQPVAIHYESKSDLCLPSFEHYMYAGKNGMTVLDFDNRQRQLQKSNYVFVSTPLRVDGAPGDEAASRHALDVVAGVMRAHAGLNLMRDLVFDGEVDAQGDEARLPRDEIRMPRLPEGPFVNEHNWLNIAEIVEALQCQPEHRRNRLQLALEYFNRAQQELHDAFFYYWTALEMVCGGSMKVIRAKVVSCYGLEGPEVVNQATSLEVFVDWRDKLFHQGERPPLSADIERYLQFLVLDLLRQELRLPLLGYLAVIQEAPGYDLSPIGLTNRAESSQS